MDAATLRNRRWDIDTRGSGIGEGTWLLPDLGATIGALGTHGWITEEPDAHLLPHLRRACQAADSPWTLRGTDLQGTVYLIDLDWRRPDPHLGRLRADAFALIGVIAESATFVRQRLTAERIEFHFATGMLDGDGPFKGHGHLLRLRISGEPIAQMLAGAPVSGT